MRVVVGDEIYLEDSRAVVRWVGFDGRAVVVEAIDGEKRGAWYRILEEEFFITLSDSDSLAISAAVGAAKGGKE